VLLAGTGHAPWHGGPDDPAVPEALLESFIDDINQALPGLGLSAAEVAYVFAGLLPARSPGSRELATECVVVDHRASGGPPWISVSGVKFTEAREVADRVLRLAFPTRQAIPYSKFVRPSPCVAPDYDFAWMPGAGDARWLEPLRHVVQHEPVQYLEDLLLRRSSLGDNPERAATLAAQICGLFDWDAKRVGEEIAGLNQRRRPAARGAAIDAA
jgi:glycerol-3-phosphate dehydrogenase